MMVLTVTIMMTTTTLSLLLSNTPIMLGINILLMALLLSATIATLMSSWYAFLVFLIYIGGMLVMFAYFLALGPNKQMASGSNFLYIAATMIVLVLLSIITNISLPLTSELYTPTFFMYNPDTSPILVVLALVLLLTMVVVVKLTSRNKGPLRPFMYV